MQQWEHIWLTIPADLGEVQVGNKKMDLNEALERLGQNGWELAGVVSSPTAAGQSVLFFKRPKQWGGG
jgi:hypothetical protein